MWMSYSAICLPRRIRKRPIDDQSANKRMVGRKLEMSTRSYIKLFDTSGEESILVSDCSRSFETRLYVHSTRVSQK